MLGYAIWFVAIFVLLYYVVFPFRIGRKISLNANALFQDLDVDDPRLPAEVRGYFDEVGQQLGPLGFTPATYLVGPSLLPGMTTFIAVFVNPTARDLAQALTIWTRLPNQKQVNKLYAIGFGTEFADRSQVITGNETAWQWRARLPYESKWRFPGMGDCERLYRLHREHTNRHGGAKSPLPETGQCREALRDDATRDADEQVRQGYVYVDSQNARYRHTLKGCYLGIWSLQWPFVAIRRRLCMRRARAIMTELGMPPDYERVDYKRLLAPYATAEPLDLEFDAVGLDADSEDVPHAPPSPPRHSGLGIASFVLGLLGLSLICVIVGVLFVAVVTSGGDVPRESPVMAACALALMATLAAGLTGVALGWAGLRQSNRKKVFAVLGLCFSAVPFLALALLMLVAAYR